MRLNKVIATSTGMSRRAADDAIALNRVTVNGSIATLGQRIEPSDVVTLDGKPLDTRVSQPITIMLNKPVGYVVSRDGQGSQTIYELLPDAYHQLKPVGRLDKESSGLLLMTNDGQLAFELTHPSRQKVKIYEATLNKPLAPLHQQMITDYGVMLEDGPSKFMLEPLDNTTDSQTLRSSTMQGAAEARTEPYTKYGEGALAVATPQRAESDSRVGGSAEKQAVAAQRLGVKSREKWRITMHEGRNRQIRRTFAALGYGVRSLHRTHFGPYTLASVKPGQFETVRQ